MPGADRNRGNSGMGKNATDDKLREITDKTQIVQAQSVAHVGRASPFCDIGICGYGAFDLCSEVIGQG